MVLVWMVLVANSFAELIVSKLWVGGLVWLIVVWIALGLYVMGIIQRPVVVHFLPHMIFSALVCDVTSNHCEFYCATSIAEFGD